MIRALPESKRIFSAYVFPKDFVCLFVCYVVCLFFCLFVCLFCKSYLVTKVREVEIVKEVKRCRKGVMACDVSTVAMFSL